MYSGAAAAVAAQVVRQADLRRLVEINASFARVRLERDRDKTSAFVTVRLPDDVTGDEVRELESHYLRQQEWAFVSGRREYRSRFFEIELQPHAETRALTIVRMLLRNREYREVFCGAQPRATYAVRSSLLATPDDLVEAEIMLLGLGWGNLQVYQGRGNPALTVFLMERL